MNFDVAVGALMRTLIFTIRALNIEDELKLFENWNS